MEGLLKHEDKAVSYITNEYKDCGFDLEFEGAPELNVDFRFFADETFDPLIPANSSKRLFKGSCVIVVSLKQSEIFRKTLHSKVISCEDQDQALVEISQYLVEQALCASYGVFSRVFDGD